jgi:hypothetical protein
MIELAHLPEPPFLAMRQKYRLNELLRPPPQKKPVLEF